MVRPPELSAVGAFRPDGQGGLVAPAADLDGRWGYLDGDGRRMSGPALGHATGFDGEGLSRFRADGAWGYAGTDGAPVVPARFTEAGPFSYGLAVVRTPEGVGCADTAGTVVVGGAYRDAGRFGVNGLGGVMLPDGRCGNEWTRGFLDVTGAPAIGTCTSGPTPSTPAVPPWAVRRVRGPGGCCGRTARTPPSPTGNR
ncbi:WG repeat-containing protein [Streptomyces manipurensis]|uniref:WG repeat-containing protein n=1 Tax=Streptomyces manipurensis TaxID=1077945 RepID=UPI003C6FCA65